MGTSLRKRSAETTKPLVLCVSIITSSQPLELRGSTTVSRYRSSRQLIVKHADPIVVGYTQLCSISSQFVNRLMFEVGAGGRRPAGRRHATRRRGWPARQAVGRQAVWLCRVARRRDL